MNVNTSSFMNKDFNNIFSASTVIKDYLYHLPNLLPVVSFARIFLFLQDFLLVVLFRRLFFSLRAENLISFHKTHQSFLNLSSVKACLLSLSIFNDKIIAEHLIETFDFPAGTFKNVHTGNEVVQNVECSK